MSLTIHETKLPKSLFENVSIILFEYGKSISIQSMKHLAVTITVLLENLFQYDEVFWGVVFNHLYPGELLWVSW